MPVNLQRIFLPSMYYDGCHGEDSTKNYLGLGILYYAIPYLLRSKICVCIGSGLGYVPSLMRQAQKDANVDKGITYLIDANLPGAGWGQPHWLPTNSEFRKTWSDIQILLEKSVDAAAHFADNSISYLHIDGDHSYEGVSADCTAYFPKLTKQALVTLHDTNIRNMRTTLGVPRKVEELKLAGFNVVNLPFVAAGVAIVQKSG